MPRNGSGVYTLPQPSFVAGTVISSAAVNSDFSDIAAALTGSLPRDGQAGMLGQFKGTDGSTPVPSITFVADPTTGFSRSVSGPNSQIGVSIGGVNVGNFTTLGWAGPVTGTISGLGSVPIATVISSATSTTPAGWLLCNGQAVSRTTYAALFAAIGTIYGTGDGSTTFNLPDLRGRVAYGADNMGSGAAGVITSTYYGTNPDQIGAYGGAQNHTLTVNEAPAGLAGNNSTAFGITVNTGGGHIPLGTTALQDTGYGSGPIHGPATLSNAGTWTDGGTSISGTVGGGAFNIQITNAGNQPHANLSPGLTLYKYIYAGV